ncbi:1,4-alpha-glucan branching protein GlgB [Desulfopila inferna]|uniref:1,4-alpha-glucan branching protein GlgB n=1 Tax=Desulfopila inferna TaxID=468528 RepID=UPI0019644234|nr:1,4-alpha-glucan branching protein GlgB [Desulfopila inferna]MBM9604854.1 1,4-alpha-glucan branching protein GlgB [Desulfopila inferna]
MSHNTTNGTAGEVRYDFSLLSKDDIYLFNEGSHFRIYEKLGAHPAEHNGERGIYFAVWAPNAEHVGVMASFNDWNKDSHVLQPYESSGIWHGFIPGIHSGIAYKYYIRSHHKSYRADKTDPFAFFTELSPQTASVAWNLDYAWQDRDWMEHRHIPNNLNAPISIYEVHLGSWMHVPEENNRSLTYRELAPRLIDYLHKMGFTHVEFLPVMEHPFFGSWGYQSLGYFAPTSRFGTPQDLMYLIDQLHQNGLGVILDWVPSHFPTDEHGLSYFDGTHLYEHEDPRLGYHPDWGSYIFNYGRNEVVSFLISSALFWLDKYHIDGFRVDAVASMLYLDYSRKEGEWIPNRFGGKENLEAIAFLKRFNEEVHINYPDVLTIAEESTDWPQVSRPTYIGGLGFDMKWDMGWMHDTLAYMSQEPIHRSYHHNKLTFRMLYAFHENYILPLSHDEVVHGKGSLLGKMPGDEWQKFANLRLLFGYMYSQPAKKLLFMGAEIGQWNEWNHSNSLDWHLLENSFHKGLQRWLEDLNQFYRKSPAMHEKDFSHEGFEWIDCNDVHQSTLSLVRHGHYAENDIIIVCNFTPVPRHNYRIGVSQEGIWKECLNSDARDYGGSNQGNLGSLEAAPIPCHGHYFSINLVLPPLGIVFFRKES